MLGSLGNGNTQRLDPLSSQNTTRMGWIVHCHQRLLMMIDVIHRYDVFANEAEVNAPVLGDVH